MKAGPLRIASTGLLALILPEVQVIGMGFSPGPRFGEILKAVEEAQLEGEIATPEDAREFVIRSWGGGPRP